MRTRLAWLFPRASERRVFLKWRSAIHPYIFILTSSHAHIFTSSHPHLLTSSISFFSSSHLHLFISSHHRQNLNLHVLTSPRHILKSSYHNIFFSSHPHLFTSSISFFSSYIFISSYLHTLYIIFYIFFSEISWYISLFMLHAIPSSDLHISLHLSSLSGHPSSSFFPQFFFSNVFSIDNRICSRTCMDERKGHMNQENRWHHLDLLWLDPVERVGGCRFLHR